VPRLVGGSGVWVDPGFVKRGPVPQQAYDATALNSKAIDVGARIAWTTRTARLLAGAGNLRDFATVVGSNPTRVHRLETARLRDGALVDAYEHALGVPVGSLRAPVDIVCRTFPHEAPADQDPGSRVATVREMSRLTDGIRGALGDPGSGRVVSGGQWLTWARALSSSRGIGLPESIALPMVDALIGEMNRSVGTGYPTRYEALSLLRCSDYGYLVVEAARTRLLAPRPQVIFDMMSAVGEAASADAVSWCLDLLDDPRTRVVRGAAVALENMGAIAADRSGYWGSVVQRLVDSYCRRGSGSPEWATLSHLIRLAPQALVAPHLARLPTPLAPAGKIKDYSRSKANQYWSACEREADRVSEQASLGSQPMLCRLLYDIAISPHETRAVTSYMLLSALPRLVPPAADAIAATSEALQGQGIQDAVVAARAARRVGDSRWAVLPERIHAWVATRDIDQRVGALMLAGNAGVRLADAEYARALDLPETREAAVYALGMCEHPKLSSLAADARDDVAGAARWWLREGPRVTA
jgi:hypothetical protein